VAACRRWWWWCWVALATACATGNSDEFETCSVDLSLDRDRGAPAEEITVTADPLTWLLDTSVLVGGVPAAVRDLTRSETCEDCDSCRDEAGCAACGLCAGLPLDASRRTECFGDPLAGSEGSCDQCVQTLTFVVPELAPGPTTLVVLNGTGQSPAVPFEVLAGAATTPTP
jgi:hypothetical protein